MSPGPAARVIIPGTLHRQFADTRIIETPLPERPKKWMDYMLGFVTNGIIAKDAYGDWCVPPEDPKLIHSKDPGRQTDKAAAGHRLFLLRPAAHGAVRDDARQGGRRTPVQPIGRGSQNGVQREVPEPRTRPVRQRHADLLRACRWRFGLVPDDQRQRVFDQLVEQDHRAKAKATSAPA